MQWVAEHVVYDESERGLIGHLDPTTCRPCLSPAVLYFSSQLVLRTQDVKESVRKAAFRTLGEDVSYCCESGVGHVAPRAAVRHRSTFVYIVTILL